MSLGLFSILLQTTSLGGNTQVLQGFGVTDVATMYNAAQATAAAVQRLCMPLAGIAMLILVATQMTKWAMGEREFDWMTMGRFLLMALFLGSYMEIMPQVNGIITYFSSGLGETIGGYGSGHALTDKVNIMLEKTRNKQDFSFWKDGLSNLIDWLISNCTQIIIIVARAVIYCIRELTMMFLMAVGPVAIALSMFPVFSGSASHWFKMYISVGMWAFTLTMFDMLLSVYLDNMIKNNDDTGLIIMNIGIMLMYLSVPHLTSKFISGVHSQSMQKMVGMAMAASGTAGRVAVGRDGQGGAKATFGALSGAAMKPLSSASSKGFSGALKMAGSGYKSIREKVSGNNFSSGSKSGEGSFNAQALANDIKKNDIGKQSKDNI